MRSRQGIRVHRTTSLDAVVHDGLPLTDPARTLRDLERTVPTDEVERAKERAAVLGLVLPDDDPYHGTRQAFERDRRKDAALQAAGYRVIRITYRRLTKEPHAVSAQLGALLRPA